MATESLHCDRNLVLCFDDNVTTLQSSLFTNLHKMTTIVQNDAKGGKKSHRKQLVWHHKGPLAVDVGETTQRLPTDSPEVVELKKKARYNTVPAPGVQWDAKNTVLEGYLWLAKNYEPGDRILVFGASRGAYIARVLAGLLATVKVTPRSTLGQGSAAWDAYVKCSTGGDNLELVRKLAQDFRNDQDGHEVSVYFLGLWDTLAPEIIEHHSPSKKTRAAGLPLVSCMEAATHIRHAMALQEKRASMDPHPYISTRTTVAEILASGPTGGLARKEVWFLGASLHVVGGARKYQHAKLDGIALRWMLREACLFDLSFELDNLLKFQPLEPNRPELPSADRLRDIKDNININVDLFPRDYEDLVAELLINATRNDSSFLIGTLDASGRDNLLHPDEIDDSDQDVQDGTAPAADVPVQPPGSFLSRLGRLLRLANRSKGIKEEIKDSQQIQWLNVIPPQRAVAPYHGVHATLWAVAPAQVGKAIKQSGVKVTIQHGCAEL